MDEVDLIIATWIKEFDIEQTWPSDLHPADVLDKYVFPALAEQIRIAEAEQKP